LANPTKYPLKLAWLLKLAAQWVWYLLALLILIATQFPEWVANYYTIGLFKWFSYGLRWMSSSFHYAIGEYVYLFIIIVLVINILKHLLKYYNQFKIEKNSKEIVKQIAKRTVHFLVQVFVLFMLIWGLNYQQSSPAKSFGLQVNDGYSDVAIEQLTLQLIEELNSTRAQIADSALTKVNINEVFSEAIQEYAQIEMLYPFLKLTNPSLKQARFPQMGDYVGYMAFYHPITGEAIIRGDLPLLTLPFTTCHEIAHQLGYASETEANFIAFVIGTESKRPLFNYSMLLQLFSYAQTAELNFIAKAGDFENWKKVAERNKKLLSPKVLADRKKIKVFFLARQGLLIPASTSMYNQFLLWNKQAKGIDSYDDVLLWALAYRAKK
jgi:cytochrome b561